MPNSDLAPVILLFEEYEAIRLLDYEGMTQFQAAEKMSVSRPTLTGICEKARRTIAMAFVEGKPILIEGGDFHTDEFWYRCEACFKLLTSKTALLQCSHCESDKIRPLLPKPGKTLYLKSDEETDLCVCRNCNAKIPHQPGTPCRLTDCPECGNKMTRENSYHHQLFLNTNGTE
ncbi:MAG: DUF134 domain-containing protein [Bacteroidota bacterium]